MMVMVMVGRIGAGAVLAGEDSHEGFLATLPEPPVLYGFSRVLGTTDVIGAVGHEIRRDKLFVGIKPELAQAHVGVGHALPAIGVVRSVEQNVIEGIHNNVISTFNTAEASLECGVETFVLVSTDKAVNPTNVMGATKRMAEIVLQGMQQRTARTKFCMVRFGNVLESSGSVVPLFRRQIARGGPVTVTHPDVTRYFMTIPEAVQLVLQAGSMAEGGDVFVLDMGQPIRIADLARRMVLLAGLTVRDEGNPDGDVEIRYTGLRPAEKLYEELLIGTNACGTEHPMIMRAMEHSLPWEQVQYLLRRLLVVMDRFDVKEACDLLREVVCEYRPNGDIVDRIWIRCGEERRSPSKIASLDARRSVVRDDISSAGD